MSPGPAVIYVMRTAIGSRGYGLRAALGVATATTLWVAVAALGVTALLQHFPRLIDIIRLSGGVYFLLLCWKLGASALRAQEKQSAGFVPDSSQAAYRRGVIVNGTSPGSALFFTSLFSLYNISSMPLYAQLAVYLGIPLLSVSWYGGLSRAFSNARLSRGYLKLRRPLDGALAVLFFFLAFRLLL